MQKSMIALWNQLLLTLIENHVAYNLCPPAGQILKLDCGTSKID